MSRGLANIGFSFLMILGLDPHAAAESAVVSIFVASARLTRKDPPKQRRK